MSGGSGRRETCNFLSFLQHVCQPPGIPLKGWHSLRHSYTLLRQNGNNPRLSRISPQHATYNITANIYDAEVFEGSGKRTAGAATCNLPQPVPRQGW